MVAHRVTTGFGRLVDRDRSGKPYNAKMSVGQKNGLWPERRTSLGNARSSLLIGPSEDGSAFGNTFATAAVHG